jgi:hypothetical protein
MLPGKLQYLRRNQLDIDKWDHCISTAGNGLVYAYARYLDHMAPQWDALVWNNYEAVMPLVWRTKWGIRYLYQPSFVQQLGIFTAQPLSAELIQQFLSELPRRFRFAEVFLNHGHPPGSGLQHANFILSLQAPYPVLQANYKQDLVKNLKRAHQFELTYSEWNNVDLVLTAYKELYGSRFPHVTHDDYGALQQLCAGMGKEQVLVRVVKEKAQLLAAAVLLQKDSRLYLLVSVTWPEGRSRAANHFLIDRLIAEFAGTNKLLDFEGSDLPGVAHFYKNFGSVNQPYYFYRYNRLPVWLRWLKQ